MISLQKSCLSSFHPFKLVRAKTKGEYVVSKLENEGARTLGGLQLLNMHAWPFFFTPQNREM